MRFLDVWTIWYGVSSSKFSLVAIKSSQNSLVAGCILIKNCSGLNLSLINCLVKKNSLPNKQNSIVLGQTRIKKSQYTNS